MTTFVPVNATARQSAPHRGGEAIVQEEESSITWAARATTATSWDNRLEFICLWRVTFFPPLFHPFPTTLSISARSCVELHNKASGLSWKRMWTITPPPPPSQLRCSIIATLKIYKDGPRRKIKASNKNSNSACALYQSNWTWILQYWMDGRC